MKSKIPFMAGTLLCFAMIFLYNYFTPHFSDDLTILLKVQGKNSLFDLMKMAYQVYLDYNPRIIGHFSTYLAANMSKSLFNILNSFFFVLLIYFIYYITFGFKKRYNIFLFLFSLFFFWRYAVEFGDTMLWLSGATSYLWPMTIMLAFITFYRQILKSDKPYQNNFLYAGLFILAVFAGWCNENTSGGTILLILIFTAFKVIELKKEQKKLLRPELFIAPVGVILGFIGLLSSPGAYKRMGYFDEEYTGMVGLFSRLYKCIVSMQDLFFELFIILIITTIFLVVVKKKWQPVWEQVIPFLVAGIATCLALVLIPAPTARAYFGAGVFLVIACLQSFALLFDQSDHQKSLSYIIFASLGLWLFFDYQANLVNLARINREENERVAIISEAILNGEKAAVVPQYRDAFKNRYSSIHRSDMTEDPEYWINQYYRNFYDIDIVIALPREAWDENNKMR